MTPELELMQRVKIVCGDHIDAAVRGTVYPAALLAALTANECGGNPGEVRFEPNVLWPLTFTLIGRKANYGAIGGRDIEEFIPASFGPKESAIALVNLASSWGPTQIMGYEALAWHVSLSEIAQLEKHYPYTVRMLEDFRKRFGLPGGSGADFTAYFDCWNTGRVHARTADPQYIPNGLARMGLYAQMFPAAGAPQEA